jgi:HAE1 family hydrophobic/amphiphilic exporter-1
MSKKYESFLFTVKRPVAIIMITVAVTLFGYIAVSNLPLNLMPDLAYPTITIRTEYPGSAPEEVENSISKPIEQLVGVVNNLENITSISKADQSDVILEFSWSANVDQAVLDVREQLDRFFFDDAEKPRILRYDPSLDPIMRFSIYRTDSLNNPTYDSDTDFLLQTREYADENIKRALEVLPGVAAVRVKGGLEEEIRVKISEKKLNLLNLNIRDITTRLNSENVNVAGGNIREGETEYIVRTLNEFENLTEISNIIVSYNNDVPIYLRDIGEVIRSHKDRDIITRYRNRESVELEIFKEANANIVDVAQTVNRKVFGTLAQQGYVKTDAVKNNNAFTQQMTDFLKYQLSDYDLGIAKLSDQSVFIKNSIDEVVDAAKFGGIFAVIVLFFFLRDLKSTIIVGVAIPVSIVSTFWPMDMFGVSLNLMSMGGLALGIGMLVDNAIVVLESIYRCREEGDDFIQSVLRGTKEVSSAVIASTLTTIAVFFPIVFVEGVAGQIFGDLALTVVFSLLASLAVAIFLIPMLASRKLDLSRLDDFNSSFFRTIIKFEKIDFTNKSWWEFIVYLFEIPLKFIIQVISKIFWILLYLIALVINATRYFFMTFFLPFVLNWIVDPLMKSIEFLQRIYPGIIRYALNNKSTILTLVLIPSFFGIYTLVPAIGTELIPQVHQGEFNLEVTYNVGSPVEKTSLNMTKIEEKIKSIDGVLAVSSRAGIDKSTTTKADEGEHTGKITITLKPQNNMKVFENQTIAKIRKIVEDMSGVSAKITRNEMFTFKTPVELYIKGFNLEKLKRYSNEISADIEKIPGVADVTSNVKTGKPEIHIVYNREKIAKYNLSILNVANLIRNKVLGDVSTRYRDDDRRIDITVLIDEKYKQSVNDLRRIVVNPGQDVPIMLSAIADIKIAEGPSEIRRNNQERTAVISANVTGERDLASIIGDINFLLANTNLDSDFFFEIGGQSKEMETSMNSLIGALLLAIFLVYIIMASQFESFVHPFVILFSIPLAFIGVIYVLYVMNISLSIMTYLGMIMLAGIVVNNAIVLVSHINLLREEGMAKIDAIIEGGKVRLRPILMTTFTTVLGLLPMAIGLGDGAEMRQPMAVTVISGLIASTFLTLVVIPTVYAIFDRKIYEADENESQKVGYESDNYVKQV